jgi:hypothetical protein
MTILETVLYTVRFIGWLKNFITDRNNATQNLIDSYVAATFIRRVPQRIRTTIMDRYGVNGNAPAKTFIMTIAKILRRSDDRAGLHTVHIALKPHNCKRVDDPTREIRNWFDQVEHGLVIHQVNGRGCMRKNGCRIPPGSYVSHNIGDVLHIGIIWEVYTGSRACPDPAASTSAYTPGCVVCAVRDITSERRVLHGAQLIVVQDNQQAADFLLICSTQLTGLYVRTFWEGFELERDHEHAYAYALLLAHRL